MCVSVCLCNEISCSIKSGSFVSSVNRRQSSVVGNRIRNCDSHIQRKVLFIYPLKGLFTLSFPELFIAKKLLSNEYFKNLWFLTDWVNLSKFWTLIYIGGIMVISSHNCYWQYVPASSLNNYLKCAKHLNFSK